jgi:hypothetical protein
MMKSLFSHFILVVFLLVGCRFAYGQSSWDNYKPRTLNEIIKRHSHPEAFKVDSFLTANTFPSQVKVTYTGTSRKIPVAKKAHISDWVKMFKADMGLVDLFETELLFIENSVEYWLPVQKQVIPYFEQELKKGETVTLFTIWIGAKKIEGKWNWVFLVNEFEK